MVYNPATDFLGLWRASGGNVSKGEMPALDLIISALARAGIIVVSVSATAPVVNQSTTAWLRAAVPSWTAEGTFFLWDKVTTAYLAATPALFLQFLQASAGQNGASVYSGAGGPPLNTLGLNGDFYIRTDEPGGIFGPKAAGAWPPVAIPGTVNTVTSAALDNTFGATPGQMLYRGAGAWTALPIGAEDTVLTSLSGLPAWDALSTLMDVLFGSLQGSILFRDVGAWDALPPGTATQVLSSGGPLANPSWVARTPEFVSGTTLVFYQPAAPVGWTKQVAINDYAMRVVSGLGGAITPGSAFSTVFAQTTVGNTTLSVGQIPPHDHSYTIWPTTTAVVGAANFAQPTGNGAATTGQTGGGAAHNHSVNLTLSYVDVIIASKN